MAIGDFLAEARSVMGSLDYAAPELETLHFGRLCAHVPDVCSWNADAGIALATVLVHRSMDGLKHLIDKVAQETARSSD